MAINWRERFVAAAIHFLATLALAALAAALIFLVWFPGALADMVGGTRLFEIIILVDVALGPLISLVIYSSRKSRRELIVDYTIVGVVQIAALVYGIATLSVSRPVIVAFVQDRIEVVTAIELEKEDLAAARDPAHRENSWSGPRLVSIEVPEDPKERNEVVMAALSGKDVQMMPKYYRAYDSASAAMEHASKPIDTLPRRTDREKQLVERAVADSAVPASSLRWVLVHHRFGFAVALVDARTRRPVGYVLMDPTEPPVS